MADLFSAGQASGRYAPLAERLRPRTLDEVVGQTHLLGPGKPLRVAFESGRPHSMIFWGPPGVGKTTLARLMADGFDAQFIAMSAVLGGVKDIRDAVVAAQVAQGKGRRTILFVDEVHRFNKAQQDAFLPYVESGLFTFIGATTENPSFEVNSALLSRARVYVLQPLSADELRILVDRAIELYNGVEGSPAIVGTASAGAAPAGAAGVNATVAKPEATGQAGIGAAPAHKDSGDLATDDSTADGSAMGGPTAAQHAADDSGAQESRADKSATNGLKALSFDEAAIAQLAAWADGDARRVINAVEVVAEAARGAGRDHVDSTWLETALSQNLRRFDKGGDAFYDQISALHKAVRGSDPDAALYWFSRMLDGGADPRYLSRRLVRMAVEDIGLADPRALDITMAGAEVYERLGSPEGELALAQGVVYLACAAKSNAVYTAYKAARRFAEQHGSAPVPVHLRNAPTKLMKQLGYGREYRYAHDEPHGYVPDEQYFPDGLRARFYQPTDRGLEGKIGQKLAFLDELDRQERASRKGKTGE